MGNEGNEGIVHHNAQHNGDCAIFDRFVVWSVFLLSLVVGYGCGGNKPAGEREAHLSIGELQERLQSNDPEIRLGAVQGLRHHRTEAAPVVADLTRVLLNDDDVRVRQTAALTLGEIGPAAASAVAALANVLSAGGNDALRHQAAVALGKIGPAAKSALPVLRAQAQSGPQIVRTAARDAIQQIQGAPTKK